MEGTYGFEKRKAVKKAFFSAYFLDVNPGRFLNVLTLNKKRSTSAEFRLDDVDVVEQGVIQITDYETFKQVLSNSSLGEDLKITSKDHITTIDDGNLEIELEQRESIDIEELKNAQVIKNLDNWSKHHHVDATGILFLHHDHPAIKGDENVFYPMRIIVKKKDLTPLVGIVVNLIKDSKTRIISDGEKIVMKSGQANSRIKLLNAKVSFENKGNEIIEFDREFYSLQTIIPNLFDIIEINAKIPSSKNCINFFIKSEDPKLRMKTKIAFSSIIEVIDVEE